MSDFIGELGASIIGWLFLMAMLSGAFALGSFLAGHFVGAEHRDAAGILSAMTLIWLYESRRAHDRWNRFFEKIENLQARG